MTTVEILFRSVAPPTEAVAFALANIRKVYGFHALNFDRAARTLRVEYDATRLNAPAVTQLIRQAGLEVIAASAPILPQLVSEQAPKA